MEAPMNNRRPLAVAAVVEALNVKLAGALAAQTPDVPPPASAAPAESASAQ
jgi:hypothetical protein